jgi:hypothetical protein
LALLISQTWAVDLVQQDLLNIIGLRNGSFETVDEGMTDAEGGPTLTVHFIEPVLNSTPSEQLVGFLAGQDDYLVLILGVSSAFQFQSGRSITDIGGRVFPPTPGSEWILLYYDMQECAGKLYHVYDKWGGQLRMLRQAVLAHELGHARHIVIGDEPATQAAKEAQAIGDENALRSQFGFPLRDPANQEGGCGFTGHQTTFWDTVCFIAGAAEDSSEQTVVRRLTRVRDGMLRTTMLGLDFFDDLFAEYYQYSPRIAREMRADPELRRAITRFLVEPLLLMLEQLRSFCADPSDDVRGAEERARKDFDGYVSQRTAAERRMLGAWRAAMEKLPPESPPEHRRGASLPQGSLARASSWHDPDSLLTYLRDRLHPGKQTLRMTRWALLDLVCAAWDAIEPPDRSHPAPLVPVMEQWLERVPLSTRYLSLPAETIRLDLHAAKMGAFANPRMHASLRRAVAHARDRFPTTPEDDPPPEQAW